MTEPASTFRPEAENPSWGKTKRLGRSKYRASLIVGRLDFPTAGLSVQVDSQVPFYLCIEAVRWRLVACIYDNTQTEAM